MRHAKGKVTNNDLNGERICRKYFGIQRKTLIFAAKRKEPIMNAVSMNNLWTYLQGLALTADNWSWLASKSSEMSQTKGKSTVKVNQKYRISPRRKKLMESISLDHNDFKNDERAQYILSK